MSPDEPTDLDARIRRLAPQEVPPAGLRARVLGAVEEALVADREPRVDRWLERPWPWLAAAAALLLVFLAGEASERAFRDRIDIPEVPAVERAGGIDRLRRFLGREQELATLGGRGGRGSR